jgi:hypothetical protein
VLLYGPDADLVRERAETIARSVCPDLKDPFRVADLVAAVLTAHPARLADEAAQLTLAGGRRVVQVRGAGDTVGKLFAEFLEEGPGDAFVVVEAGDLPSRSALRRAFEAARHGAAIGCYPDTSRDLAAVIRDTLSEHQITATRDATLFLVEHLGGDRLLTRSELEKLALYAGDGGHIDLEDARLSVSDTAGLEVDDAVMAAAEGDAARQDSNACLAASSRKENRPFQCSGHCCATSTGCIFLSPDFRLERASRRCCEPPVHQSSSSNRTVSGVSLRCGPRRGFGRSSTVSPRPNSTRRQLASPPRRSAARRC